MGLFDLIGTTGSGWLTDRVDPKRLLVWVNSAGYPDEQAFFAEANWPPSAGEILSRCKDLQKYMVEGLTAGSVKG